MNKKFPFPRRYWVYAALSILMPILAGVNIYRTDSWCGDLPFAAYGTGEWSLFALFITEELLLLALCVVFICKCAKISGKRDEQVLAYYRSIKTDGYDADQYEDEHFLWCDSGNTVRAFVKKSGAFYRLTVQGYNTNTDLWEDLETDSLYSSLDEVKKALVCDYNFHWNEITDSDKYIDENYCE